MRPRAVGLLAALLACSLGTLLVACGEEPPRTTPDPPSGPAPGGDAVLRAGPPIGSFPRDRFLIERDLFLAADEPAVVPAAEARFLHVDDEVFGVVVGGVARAYPIPMISYHHVVNDVIGGIPVAITY